MLGPVVLILSLFAGRLREGAAADAPGGTAGMRPGSTRVPVHQLVPWFIVGFLLVAVARSLGLLPAALLPTLAWLTTMLTTISMAGLGLGVDVRVVAGAGARVTAAVTLSLLLLGAISLGLIRLLGVA